MSIQGYRSIDGGAVVRLRCVFNDILSVWARSLSRSDSLEFVHYGKSLNYFAVYRCELKQGSSYYTYRIEVIDDRRISLYTILIDSKGFAKVEVRYGAQRDNYFLQTGYRELFDFLGFKILDEQLARVDLALTLKISPDEVISYVKENKYYSLLSRKSFVQYGDVDKPNSVRFGSWASVQVAIYDKAREVLEESFKLSYAAKLEDYVKYFGDSSDVVRIEYRLSRTYLKNVGLTSPDVLNDDLAGVWLTMNQKYFCPTESYNDGKHKVEVASWWQELPDLIITMKTGTYDNVYYHLHNKRWLKQYEMMLSRAQGYLASIVASMARVPGNLNNALQIVYRRLLEDSGIVYERACSRFALS